MNRKSSHFEIALKKFLHINNIARLLRHIFAYSLPFIGVFLLFLLGYGIIFPSNDILYEITKTLALVLITGGILSMSMSALKFFSYFETKLSDILYGKSFLEQRKDLDHLWSTITSILYHRRFPKIADKIHVLLKNRYLNSSQDYYSSYVEYKTNITENANGEYIIKDVIKQKIIASSSEKFTIEMNSGIDYRPDEEGQVFNRIMKILVDDSLLHEYSEGNDGKDEVINEAGGSTLKINRRIIDSYNGKNLQLHYYVTLAGKKSYTLTRVLEKKYSLEMNPVKKWTASHIYRRMSVFVDYPEGIILDYSPCGTLGEFKKIETGNLCKLQLEYNDILLPSQGIILGLAKSSIKNNRELAANGSKTVKESKNGEKPKINGRNKERVENMN